MLSPMFHLLVLGVGVGSNANFSVCAGGNANFSIFRYQHPQNEIGGSKPTRGPKANGFALQWNIGLIFVFNFNLVEFSLSRLDLMCKLSACH